MYLKHSIWEGCFPEHWLFDAACNKCYVSNEAWFSNLIFLIYTSKSHCCSPRYSSLQQHYALCCWMWGEKLYQCYALHTHYNLHPAQVNIAFPLPSTAGDRHHLINRNKSITKNVISLKTKFTFFHYYGILRNINFAINTKMTLTSNCLLHSNDLILIDQYVFCI